MTHSPDVELDDQRDMRRYRNVGGTPGGLGEFFLGLALLICGGYLFLENVIVTSSIWHAFFGFSSFGLTLIPLFIGIAFLFFNGKSMVGWVLTVGGAIMILVGVIAHLNIFFRPTSLFNTLLMLALIASGLGLILRSLRSHERRTAN